MNEMGAALLVSGLSIVGQLVIGYWWKRGVESKDEKITKLEDRIEGLETQTIGDIREDVRKLDHNLGSAFSAIRAHTSRLDRAETSLKSIETTIPQIARISEQLAVAAAQLESVSQRMEQIGATQQQTALKIAKMEART